MFTENESSTKTTILSSEIFKILNQIIQSEIIRYKKVPFDKIKAKFETLHQNQLIKNISNNQRKFIRHYRLEIIRYWNNINFILKKTLRSSNFSANLVQQYQGLLYYFIIRIHHENSSKEELFLELPKMNFDKNQIKSIRSLIIKIFSFNWDIALQKKQEEENISIKHSIPSFTIQKLRPYMPLADIIKNMNFLDKRARKGFFSLRINQLKFNKEELMQFNKDLCRYFLLQNINYQKDNDFRYLFSISVKDKIKIIHNKWLEEGKIIIQDKASILSISLLEPNPQEIIGDFCAAPGMKSSLIAEKSNNEALIIANDFNSGRIRSMKTLSHKFGIKNIHLIQSDSCNDSIPISKLKCQFDKILIDAPCTGSGIFSTNPELKWKQNSRFLARHIKLQEKILASATDLLKPDGILVYTTCSLYVEEGEFQITQLPENFKPLSLPQWFSPSYLINGKPIPGTGRLFPSLHHTIGFFVSKFQKINE